MNQQKINFQKTQEYALLLQIIITFIPLLIPQLSIFNYNIKFVIVVSFICILILIQFCIESISNKNIISIIVFIIYIPCKIILLYELAKNPIYKSFIIIMIITYCIIYCFLKLSESIQGKNELLVRQYIFHIIIISFITLFVLIQQLYITILLLLLQWLFMCVYTIYLLLDLQLIFQRVYLENNYLIICVLIDSDLIAPGNLFKLQMLSRPKLIIQQPIQIEEESELNLDSDIQDDQDEQ